MKYKLRKTVDPELVDAEKLKEPKKIKGKYFKDLEYEALPGEWLVTYHDGSQEAFNEQSFNRLFEPLKQMLYD